LHRLWGSSTTDQSSRVAGANRLNLQLSLPERTIRSQSALARASAQGRQNLPCVAGFIERLEVRIENQGVLLTSQSFQLTSAEQQGTITREITLPEAIPPEFQVVIEALNGCGNKLFVGSTSITRGTQETIDAAVTLVRGEMVTIPATPAELQHTAFQFQDGAAFGLTGMPVTLTMGTFQGDTGDFSLVTDSSIASGMITISSCDFVITASTFAVGQQPQVGDEILSDPCEIDAIDGSLILTNVILSTTSVSQPDPAEVPPIPPPIPPLIEIPENTSNMTQVAFTPPPGGRPSVTNFAVTIPPAHGTATVDNNGLITYTPAANFSGKDQFVVTVTVRFTDGNLPSAQLGTVVVPLTVLPVNDPPVVPSPGNQSTFEGTPVSLLINASDPEGDTLTFSAVSLPPGLSIDPATGRITGTPPQGASSGSPYAVTVRASETATADQFTTPVSFTWTITPGLPGFTAIIGPPDNPVVPTGTFSVAVIFDTGGADIVSYAFALSFDPEVLQVFSLVGVPPFDRIAAAAEVASGTVVFAANNADFLPAHGVFEAAKVTFTVVGTQGDRSDISLAVPSGGTVVEAMDTNRDGRFDQFQPLPTARIFFAPRSVNVQ